MEEIAIALAVIALVVLIVCPIWTLIVVLLTRRTQREQAELVMAIAEDVEALRRARQQPAPAAPMPQPAPSAPVAAHVTALPAAAPATGAVAQPGRPSPVAPAPATPPPLPVSPRVSAPVPAYEPEPAPVREPGPLELKAREMLGKIWNWLVIGEEFRKPGTSWEFAVATNWLLRIGVVALVIGIGFFLKYSIDHGLLGPRARVALSVAAGVGMLIAGVRLVGKPYHLFGQGMMGGGLAVLYFSMFASCNLYHLVGILPAFGLMILVTLVAGVLAVRLNSLLVAVLGILGGYGTPVMLSTGTKNFPGLFGYMLVLGIGVLGISRLKRWPLLNYLGLVLTYGLAAGSMARFYGPADLPAVLPFLSGFFLLYAAVMFLYNIAHREKATVIELLGIILNSVMFFGLGYRAIIAAHPERFTALLALVLAAFYIGLVWLFLSRRQNDRGLLFTFLALAALFVALTPPLAISRQWVTASWALQGLVMLWLAGKIESRFLRLLGCAAFLLAAGRLAFVDLHRQFAMPVPADATWLHYLRIAGSRLLAVGVPIAALGGAWKLLYRPPAAGALAVAPGNDLPTARWQPGAAGILAIIGIALLFVYAHFELYRTSRFFFPESAMASMTLAWFALGFFLLTCARRFDAVWPVILLSIAGAGMLFKLLILDIRGWYVGWHAGVYGLSYTPGLAVIRFADFGLCLALMVMIFSRMRGRAQGWRVGLTAGISALALLFLYLTLETNTALHRFLPGLQAAGVTILWAAYALVLLMFGLQRTVRGLRYAGLAIFTVVVFKVFFSDLAHLDAIYRIIAFIILGVILLGAALVYLKYRQRFQPTAEGDKS